MVKEECKALLDALSRVTACYRHMVLTIGGTSDSQNLREELKKTRQKAQELAVANRNKLTTVLRDKTVSKEDKAEFERLWVIFSTCLEILEIDMRRALELGHEFPLNVPKKHLIQTGMSGGTSGVAARAMSVQNMKYEAEHNIDVVDLKDLENEINQIFVQGILRTSCSSASGISHEVLHPCHEIILNYFFKDTVERKFLTGGGAFHTPGPSGKMQQQEWRIICFHLTVFHPKGLHFHLAVFHPKGLP
uniref:Regulator of G protein signaling 9 binding protein n=1 Tax=Gallus gallus TaxID=9031 RepID=A0A8V0ZZG3_CHICK